MIAGIDLSADRWTVVARRTGLGWAWLQGVHVHPLFLASDADAVIVMHRHTPGGVEIVARLAGSAWRRMRQQAREGRGRWAR